jgi:RNA polymerase sigma-70 factor, ECF subfamily
LADGYSSGAGGKLRDGRKIAGLPENRSILNSTRERNFLPPSNEYSVDPRSNLDGLMARYQAGDFAAARALVERLGPQLHRFFATQFASRADADDLLQETWLRIHRVRHTYRPGEPVLPWFYAIARRVRIDHFRRASRTTARERSLEEALQMEGTFPTAEDDQGDGLETLLAPLPEGEREVIRMMKVAGMSLEEVARATSCSVGSVKQKVHRAYKSLRERMGAMGRRKGPSGGLS